MPERESFGVRPHEAALESGDMSPHSKWRPYPAYKDSGVEWLGKIPEHWEVDSAKLGYEIYLGKMLQPLAVTSQDIQVPYLKAFHVQWEKVVSVDPPIMWASPWEIEEYCVHKNDLLVCEGGEVGRAGIIMEEPSELTIIQNSLHRVRSKSNNIRFLMYILETGSVSGWLDVICNRATIQHFTRDKFACLQILFPPEKEQTFITVFLDRELAKIDALVAKKEKLIELLKEKRAAVISHAVTKGLDPSVPMKDSGVEWLGEIPAEWEVEQIKYIVDIVGGGTPSKEKIEFWQGNIPWVSPKDMKVSIVTETEDTITEDAIIASATNLVPSEALLIVVRSGILNHTIPVAITGREVTLNQDLKALIPKERLVSKYLMYFINGLQSMLLFMWKKEGATVESLEIDNIRTTIIPLPPTSEQREITTFLDRKTSKIDSLIAKIEQGIALLKEYRSGLISAAVTGKIDVRNESQKAAS